jgi:hypothetical protein
MNTEDSLSQDVKDKLSKLAQAPPLFPKIWMINGELTTSPTEEQLAEYNKQEAERKARRDMLDAIIAWKKPAVDAFLDDLAAVYIKHNMVLYEPEIDILEAGDIDDLKANAHISDELAESFIREYKLHNLLGDDKNNDQE